MGAREAAAEYFAEQARWRNEKAGEYPDDARNVRCAAGLEELAVFVRNLPDDDERIIELGTLCVREGLFSVPPGDSADYAVSRFRFHSDNDDDCSHFLTSLVRMVREDAIRQAQFAGELPLEDAEESST